MWTEIVEHIDQPGYDGSFVTVTELDRSLLTKHPWSLSGGGASDVKALLDGGAAATLESVSESLGITSFTLEDDVFVRSSRALARFGAELTRPMVLGDQLRNWSCDGDSVAIFPYGESFDPVDVEDWPRVFRLMWPYRTNLSNSLMFGGRTKVQDGLKWSEFGRLTSSKLMTPLSITFAFVATHNHFVLDRGGKVFKQTAPIIKLAKTATE